MVVQYLFENAYLSHGCFEIYQPKVLKDKYRDAFGYWMHLDIALGI